MEFEQLNICCNYHNYYQYDYAESCMFLSNQFNSHSLYFSKLVDNNHDNVMNQSSGLWHHHVTHAINFEESCEIG